MKESLEFFAAVGCELELRTTMRRKKIFIFLSLLYLIYILPVLKINDCRVSGVTRGMSLSMRYQLLYESGPFIIREGQYRKKSYIGPVGHNIL